MPIPIIDELTMSDWMALGWFLLGWIGYGAIADYGFGERRGLVGASHRHRLTWARRICARENRIADSNLLINLMSSYNFYANTTIYIIAGLLAVMGTLDTAIDVAEQLPFAGHASREVWEGKVLLLIAVFVVAYFKFTWAIRQFNFLSILVGAAPEPTEPSNEIEDHAQRIARVSSYCGDEFNRGIRAYYFGLAAVAWFVHPMLFLVTVSLVLIVLARRDFASPTLRVLRS